jgi:hypothetical protein
MVSEDGCLVAVVAGRSEKMTAHATDADGLELAFGLLELDLFHSIKGIERISAEGLFQCLVTRKINGSGGLDPKQT